mmetsp:Transcript_555/g.823  ORF Transcript_555/g.823 Transcript_555/m.823 type:complete len:130 (+) Transcript_555:3113-3502(+)
MFTEERFQSLAQAFAAESLAFPHFQWSWVGSYLRLQTDDLEVSVVYSLAYSTPAIYFRRRFSSEPPSLPDELCVPAEHPVSKLPSFTLHSCRSSDLLEGRNELLAWLSAVLPVLGLSVPVELAAKLLKS